MAHYLVTGGCGFIGSHLVESLLSAGHDVKIIDDLSTGKRDNIPSSMDILVADIRDSSLIECALREVEGVFHLAAVASVARCNDLWLDSHGVNLGATVGLFDACRRFSPPLPIVYASSAAVYGDQQQLPLCEDMVPTPLSPYGADKAACELHARAGMIVHGMRTFGLRFFNVFGNRQSANDTYAGVITAFLHRIRAGLPAVVHGDGRQTRDFVYVGDVVECLIRAMARLTSGAAPRAEIANVASGQATSVLDLARIIGERCGRDVAVEHKPARAGEIRHSRGSVERLERLLKYRPVHSLRSGLAEMHSLNEMARANLEG